MSGRKEEAAVHAVLPPKTESVTTITSGESGSWFWRLFGGTVIGGITFLLVTLLNYLNSSIDRVRTDNVGTQIQIQTQLTDLRDRVLKLEQSSSALEEQIKELDLESVKSRVSVIEQLDKERRLGID